jgi:hypothetical protein
VSEPAALPELLLLACDGLTALEAAARRELAQGTAVERIEQATRDLAGLPSDLDGGDLAHQLTRQLRDLEPAQRQLLAELALLPDGAPLRELADRCKLSRKALEAVALSMVPLNLIRWSLAGLRLPRPIAAALRNLQLLAPELTTAFAANLDRLTARDAVVPGPLDSATWDSIAAALERLELPQTRRWQALQLLADTAEQPARRTTLALLASGSVTDPASHLLRARLRRQAGDIDEALLLTSPLIDHPELGGEANLEQARGLYTAGRLHEAALLLDRTASRFAPLAATDALRTSAAIRLGLDDADGARAMAQEALRIARENRLLIAEARAHGLLASIEAADLMLERSLEHALRARLAFDRQGDLFDRACAAVTTAQALLNLRRHAEAEAQLREANTTFTALKSPAMTATTATLVALSALDRGCPDEARAPLEEAVASIDERQPRLYAWTTAVFALLLIEEGRLLEASQRWREVAETFHAMQDHHHARLFAAFGALVGNPPLALPPAGSASTRELDQALRHHPRLSEGLWTRLLRRTSDRLAQGLTHREGLGFVVPGHPLVDLSQRPTLRRLLASLIEAMEQGEARSTDQLFEAGWQGERALPDAARARVYVAIGELRKRGLTAFLMRDGDGYRLSGLRVVDRLVESQPSR